MNFGELFTVRVNIETRTVSLSIRINDYQVSVFRIPLNAWLSMVADADSQIREQTSL